MIWEVGGEIHGLPASIKTPWLTDNPTMIHHFFDFAFFVFCMSQDIFVLSDQNGDLAGHMSKEKN